MAIAPVLIIRVAKDNIISVRARSYDDYVEHDIILNSVLAYWWSNDLPPALKFLELFDSVIKRTINELIPHKTLDLKYDVKANQTLEKASSIDINLISVVADDVKFKIDGNSFTLNNIKEENNDFESKEFNATFNQSIVTPDIVLQKYRKMADGN